MMYVYVCKKPRHGARLGDAGWPKGAMTSSLRFGSFTWDVTCRFAIYISWDSRNCAPAVKAASILETSSVDPSVKPSKLVTGQAPDDPGLVFLRT